MMGLMMAAVPLGAAGLFLLGAMIPVWNRLSCRGGVPVMGKLLGFRAKDGPRRLRTSNVPGSRPVFGFQSGHRELSVPTDFPVKELNSHDIGKLFGIQYSYQWGDGCHVALSGFGYGRACLIRGICACSVMALAGVSCILASICIIIRF